jgi:hypothetical protein
MVNMAWFRKLLLAGIFLSVCLPLYAETPRIFPSEGLQQFLGLDDTSSPPVVKDGRAADIQNILLDITGAAYKRNGYSLEVSLDTNEVGDDFEAVTGLYELYKSDGSRTKIAVGNKFYSWTTAGVKTDITGADVIASGITVGQNNQYTWASALDYAIGTNNVDPPVKINGTTASILTYGPFSDANNFTAKCVIWWKNYLVFGNTTELTVPHTTRIRWSNVGTIDQFDDDDFVDIATLGGQQIEAMATIYDDLFIFLTDSIYKVSLVGGTELINVTKVSEGIGCIAKNSVRNVGIGNAEGVIFLSRDKTINFVDGVSVKEISTLISGVMDDLSGARLPYAVSVDDRVNSHYYLAVTSGTGSTNNLLLDYHYGIAEWSKHTQIDANSMMYGLDANTNQQVYFGNYYGYIYQMNDVNLNSDVAGEVGIFDDRDIIDTDTASGLIVLYDTSADFSTATGATVRITSGTGVNEESVIVYCGGPLCSTGIVVVNSAMTATGTSVYSIGDIDAYYTTKWYDTGVATKNKNFGELFLWATTDTSVQMGVYYGTDFANTITLADVDLAIDGSLWGTAIWGTGVWGGDSSSLSRVPLNVSGRFIKLKFSENTIDEPMTLWGYSIALWDLDNF